MQIWLDPWGVRLLFESGLQLYAEERIEHSEADGTIWSYDCAAAGGPPLVLHRLLQNRIIAVDREDLRLIFRIEDGASSTIISEFGPYESGHIQNGESFIVF